MNIVKRFRIDSRHMRENTTDGSGTAKDFYKKRK